MTTDRKIYQATQIPKEAPARNVANNECDTNADMCCLGKDYVRLKNISRTAYGTNTTYILVVNENLYYGNKLDQSLINLNQVRPYGIDFWGNPFD